MQFNSLAFLIFAAVVFALWPFVRARQNGRWLFLTVASFFFYGWWDWRFLFLLTAAGLIDYTATLGMVRFPRYRKMFLVCSLLGCLGMLSSFKYLDFFIANVNWLGQWCHAEPLPVLKLALPIGISFYTFQSLSYTIDVYLGRLKPTRNILHYFAFLSLFPQLVAGPIVRATHLLPQLAQPPRQLTDAERFSGLRLIVSGFFKKVVIADVLAPQVAAAFGAGTVVDSCAYWWVAVGLFAVQIYCDFSGYSEIAIGLGRWLGYDFPTNFNHPYIASSLREFWTRWHISLSTWFRDYVYIPLGGSRQGVWRSHVYMWITMVTSGFWHGAAWPFVIWGGLHAFYLSLERVTQWPERLQRLPGGRHLAVLLTLALVLIGWVFFRCGTLVPTDNVTQLGRAWEILRQLVNVTHPGLEPARQLLRGAVGAALAIVVLRHLWCHFRLDEKTFAWPSPGAQRVLEQVVLVVMIVACVYFRGHGSTFIYFQF